MQISEIGSGGTNAVSMQQLMEEMKERWFQAMDADGDGGINATELADLAKTTGKSADEIITQFDKDQDGVLSATEFDQMMQEMKPTFRPEGMQGPPPPPPPDEQDDTDSILSDQLKSLVELLREGKTDEAETTFQNMVASLNQNRLYNASGETDTTGSLLSFKA